MTAQQGEFLYLSPAYREILGIPQGGRAPTLVDAAHAEDRPLLTDGLRRLVRDGGDTELTYRIQRTDGALRWVRTRGFAVHDRQDRVYRLVGFMDDITERKLADEALRESETQLRDLFQHSPDIIMTVDRRGKILLMNRSIPALPAERAVGHNSLALMPRDLRKWFRKSVKAQQAGAVPMECKGGKSEANDAEERFPTLKEAQWLHIQKALRRAGGNQGNAAALLGISRPALNRRPARQKE